MAHDVVGTVLITEEEIKAKAVELGEVITKDFEGE